jgi:hypothetical protein
MGWIPSPGSMLTCSTLLHAGSIVSPRAIYILSQLTPFQPLLLLCYCHSTYPSIAIPSIPPMPLLLPGHCHSSYIAFATSLSAISIYLTLTYITTHLTLPLPLLLHCLSHFSFPAVFPPLSTAVASPLTLPLPLLYTCHFATPLCLPLLLLLPYHCHFFFSDIATPLTMPLPLISPCY